jgi:hypothetical protein
MRDASRIPPDPVLDRANVAFVGLYDGLTDQMRDAQSRGYRPRFGDGFFTVFERPTAPRFLFSSAYHVVPTADALAAIASAPPLDVVLEEPPVFPSTPNSPGDPAVRVDAYRRNSIALSLDAPRPGLVYASESFFVGWTATVNGAPARILPANYAFRAVEIPAGPARVEFRYWPPGLTTGLFISGTSIVLLCVLGGLAVKRR